LHLLGKQLVKRRLAELRGGDIKPFPELGEAAYYGVFGEITKRITPYTEADPVAILMQTMAMFGCMVGDKARFRVEATDHHANLFGCLVGQSSRSRKGSSFDYVRAAVYLIEPDWVRDHLATGLHSGEGLIWAVRDPIFENQKNKQTGELERVMRDPGVDDKRLCVIEPEFAQPLKLMSRPNNILSTVLR
jgi:hypothetical protein